MKRKKTIMVILIFSILFLSFSLPINSKQINNSLYKVNKGDSNKYIYENIEMGTSNYFTEYFYLKNGSQMRYEVVQGTTITIIVVDNNASGLFTKQILNVPKLGSFESRILSDSTPELSGFIFHGFDNSTSAFNYYNSSMTFQNDNFTIKGDNITISDSYSTGYLEYTNIQLINWRTGWSQYYEFDGRDKNGLLVYHYTIFQINSNTLNKNDSSFLLDDLVFSGIFLTIALVSIVINLHYRNYRNYTKQVKNDESKLSFTKYSLNRLKYLKHNSNKKNPSLSTKTLEKLDEIIQENQ